MTTTQTATAAARLHDMARYADAQNDGSDIAASGRWTGLTAAARLVEAGQGREAVEAELVLAVNRERLAEWNGGTGTYERNVQAGLRQALEVLA